MQNIILFEDSHYETLLPLVYTRPVCDLRCGILSLKEKVQLHFLEATIGLYCRDYLASVQQRAFPDSKINNRPTQKTIFYNAGLLPDSETLQTIRNTKQDCIYTVHGRIAAALLSPNAIQQITFQAHGIPDFSTVTIPHKEISAQILTYPWEFIQKNGSEIKTDYNFLTGRTPQSSIPHLPGVHIIKEEMVHIGNDVNIKPGVVIDAERGPVYIDDGVTIMPQATIVGPAYIGKNSTVKIGAKIYENTTIGPVCKIGGEIEGCIIQGYSNKQHEGFLGHAYLGAWVNLGADTNNSDLKNNYSSVVVTLNGKDYNSGSQFMGLIAGDHVKTGINTMLNTGTVIGVAANIFGADFPPKYIPSFSWGGAAELTTYRFDKALETARIVQHRRGIPLTREDELLLHHIFSCTEKERE